MWGPCIVFLDESQETHIGTGLIILKRLNIFEKWRGPTSSIDVGRQ